MITSTIEMSPWKAKEAFREYRQILDGRRADPEDEILLKGYRELGKGRKLLDLRESFRLTGLDDEGRPKLAIARADWPRVRFHWDGPVATFEKSGSWGGNAITVGIHQRFVGSAPRERWRSKAQADTPAIPPRFRPRPTMRRHYWILWEAEWESVPADPYLLKHLGGNIYAILAVWDLTELEQAVLRGRL